MARTKGSKNKTAEVVQSYDPYIPLVETNEKPAVIHPLSVDYTSEGLNNMARKINEIVERLNYGTGN